MVLLNAEKGIPTISRRKPLDEEEREVYEVAFQRSSAEKHAVEPEPITISVNRKQSKLYVLKLEPLQEKEKANITALRKVILQNSNINKFTSQR